MRKTCLKESCPPLQNTCWRMNLELRGDKLIAGMYHKWILLVTLVTSLWELAMFIKSKRIISGLWSLGSLSENLHYKQYWCLVVKYPKLHCGKSANQLLTKLMRIMSQITNVTERCKSQDVTMTSSHPYFVVLSFMWKMKHYLKEKAWCWSIASGNDSSCNQLSEDTHQPIFRALVLALH